MSVVGQQVNFAPGNPRIFSEMMENYDFVTIWFQNEPCVVLVSRNRRGIEEKEKNYKPVGWKYNIRSTKIHKC